MFKDMLAVVDRTPQTAARLRLALGLAGRFDAHLTGLYVASPPVLPGFLDTRLGEDIAAVQRTIAESGAREAEKLFRGQVDAAGPAVRTEWLVVHGEPRDVATLHARYADLIVIGQIEPGQRPDWPPLRPEDLLLASGRPVLVVPYSGQPDSVGQRVVVAWNGSREAARAVNDALPILRLAEQVEVLVINPRPRTQGPASEPGADIAGHLARHGIKAVASHVNTNGIDPGDMLLNRVADLGADLIVMGGYGRSRLRELVLGGTTRHILHHLTVPVLLSH